MAREKFKSTVLGIILLNVIGGIIANQLGFINIRRWFGSPGNKVQEQSNKDQSATGRQQTTSATQQDVIYSRGVSVAEAIHDYNLTYNTLAISGPTSLETFYDKAKHVTELMMAFPENGGDSFLQRLKPSEVQSLVQQLPGIQFFSDATTGALARIDSAFFLAFAKKNGTPPDVAFFEDWRLAYPNTQWMPRWIEQQTDYSGCTDYRGGKIVDLYTSWSNYKAKYPGDYADDVTQELDGLRATLVGDTCACHDKESVENELKRFLSLFPNDPSAQGVVNKLRAIQEDKSEIHFNCHSG